MGFTDGALSISPMGQSGVTKAGIGGFLLNKIFLVKYSFSGPCNLIDPLSVEKQALIFILEAILTKGIRAENVYSDNFGDNERDIQITRLLDKLQGIRIAYINRKFNVQADFLAKEGKLKSHMVEGWST